MRQNKTEKKKQQSSKTAGYSAKQSKPRTLEKETFGKTQKNSFACAHTTQRRMICPLKVRERNEKKKTKCPKTNDLPLES